MGIKCAKRFLVPPVILLLGLAAILSPGCSSRDEGKRPNIILVSFCSIRADHLSCLGYPRETSPNLDAFATKAVLFESALTQWPKTTPCFSSIMTSSYAHNHGVMWKTAGVSLADDKLTLAEVLQEKGYETGAFISSGALSRRVNLLQGFDTYVEAWRESRLQVRSLYMRYELTTKDALDWVDERENPFFLWIHYNNAHYPYTPPRELAGMFTGDSCYADSLQLEILTTGRDVADLPAGHPNAAQVNHGDLGGIPRRSAIPLDPESREYHKDFAHYIAQYDAGIRWADRSFGLLVEELEERGLAEDVLWVIVGDHGEALGEHNFYFEHGRFPYDGCLHVPFLIRHSPLIEDAMRVKAPVGTFSIGTTILDILGEEAPQTFESPSLLPLLLDGAAPAPVFSESGYEMEIQLSMRDEDWKLIWVPNQRDRAIMKGTEYELYHIPSDPHESVNLIGERPDVAAALIKKQQSWAEPWWEEMLGYHMPETPPVDKLTIDELKALGYIK